MVSEEWQLRSSPGLHTHTGAHLLAQTHAPVHTGTCRHNTQQIKDRLGTENLNP